MKRFWHFVGQAIFWLGWLGLWLLLRGSHRSRVIIVSPENNILLEKGWISSGKWILPGGGLHQHEQPKIGAIREVFEETGVQLSPDDLQLINEAPVKEYGLPFHCTLFVAELDYQPSLAMQKHELTEVAWLPLDGLRGLSPLTARLLAKWRKK